MNVQRIQPGAVAGAGLPESAAEVVIVPAVAGARTLLVVNSLCMGGAEKQVVALFNGMSDARCQVSMVCIKEDPSLFGQIEPSRQPRIAEGLGVDRGFNWQAVRRLADLIDSQRIEVVLCTNMYALLYGWLARRRCLRRAQVRLVEVFHTTDVGSRKERLSMLLYRQLLRSTDLLVYVCQGQAAHWRQRGLRARQEVVIHNGIDTHRFTDRWTPQEKLDIRSRYGLQPSDYVVGLCAVMRPEKAHGDFLLALASLKRGGVKVHGMLIGDGPQRPEIERQIASLDLTDRVSITGFQQDVRPLVAACDVMVLASHAVETFSIAALESMALGKPMVMTRIGGASEQVTQGRNGLLYEAGDTEALAQALQLLADSNEREPMGREAAARVRQAFDVGRMVRSYEQALSSLALGREVRPYAGTAVAQRISEVP